MANQQISPGSTFQYLLSNGTPGAAAWVRGGAAFPAVSGLVKFFATPFGGILVEAEFFNLPDRNVPGASNFYAMHIHEFGDCSGNFAHAGSHYALPGQLHPNHAGDLVPLLANQGYAWTAFYDKRFTLDQILGRSVIVHAGPDDFRTQPSGDSGPMIACGQIMAS